MKTNLATRLDSHIRIVPNYPREGVLFRDITPILKNAELFREALLAMAKQFQSVEIDYIAAIEARGFIFGGALAQLLNIGFIPIRKKGKLPAETLSIEYMLEYGADKIEIHKDAVQKGDRVLLMDDLIATGGTALAAASLLQQQGVDIISTVFMIDLEKWGGSQQLKERGISTFSLLTYKD